MKIASNIPSLMVVKCCASSPSAVHSSAAADYSASILSILLSELHATVYRFREPSSLSRALLFFIIATPPARLTHSGLGGLYPVGTRRSGLGSACRTNLSWFHGSFTRPSIEDEEEKDPERRLPLASIGDRLRLLAGEGERRR